MGADLRGRAERDARYRKENHEQIRAKAKVYYKENLEYQERVRARAREHYKEHRAQHQAAGRRSYLKNLARRTWLSARLTAKKRGLAFTIKPEDVIIPKFCPVFGWRLRVGKRKRSRYSPSLDRINNKRGYHKDNIIVISWYANWLKHQGTAAQHRRIAEWMETL